MKKYSKFYHLPSTIRRYFVASPLGGDHQSQRGQALVTLLFFMMIGITITVAAIAILYTNTLGTTMTDQSQVAYYLAESGIEDGMLRVLRNPAMLPTTAAYNPISGQQVTVSISTTGGVSTIKSVGGSGSTVRIITVQPTYSSGILTFTNWRESNQ